MKRMLAGVVSTVVAVWIVLSASLYAAMLQTPDRFGQVMKHVPMPFMMVLPFESLWKIARGGSVNPGDPAPDFTLPALDHSGQVALASHRGVRPVVLVFGSYT